MKLRPASQLSAAFKNETILGQIKAAVYVIGKAPSCVFFPLLRNKSLLWHLKITATPPSFICEEDSKC